MDYEVEGVRPRGRPKKTWSEVIEKDCQIQETCKEDAGWAAGEHMACKNLSNKVLEWLSV